MRYYFSVQTLYYSSRDYSGQEYSGGEGRRRASCVGGRRTSVEGAVARRLGDRSHMCDGTPEATTGPSRFSVFVGGREPRAKVSDRSQLCGGAPKTADGPSRFSIMVGGREPTAKASQRKLARMQRMGGGHVPHAAQAPRSGGDARRRGANGEDEEGEEGEEEEGEEDEEGGEGGEGQHDDEMEENQPPFDDDEGKILRVLITDQKELRFEHTEQIGNVLYHLLNLNYNLFREIEKKDGTKPLNMDENCIMFFQAVAHVLILRKIAPTDTKNLLESQSEGVPTFLRYFKLHGLTMQMVRTKVQELLADQELCVLLEKQRTMTQEDVWFAHRQPPENPTTEATIDKLLKGDPDEWNEVIGKVFESKTVVIRKDKDYDSWTDTILSEEYNMFFDLEQSYLVIKADAKYYAYFFMQNFFPYEKGQRLRFKGCWKDLNKTAK